MLKRGRRTLVWARRRPRRRVCTAAGFSLLRRSSGSLPVLDAALEAAVPVRARRARLGKRDACVGRRCASEDRWRCGQGGTRQNQRCQVATPKCAHDYFLSGSGEGLLVHAALASCTARPSGGAEAGRPPRERLARALGTRHAGTGRYRRCKALRADRSSARGQRGRLTVSSTISLWEALCQEDTKLCSGHDWP